MANYSTLKAAVADVVKTNGTRAITGANLQSVLLSIINSVGGGGYIFKGVATPSTDAGTPDENVFYIGGAGTYANFGTSVTVPVGRICVFKYNGSWAKEQIALFAGIDDVPTINSDNLVKSGGVYLAQSNIEKEIGSPIFIEHTNSGGDAYLLNLKAGETYKVTTSRTIGYTTRNAISGSVIQTGYFYEGDNVFTVTGDALYLSLGTFTTVDYVDVSLVLKDSLSDRIDKLEEKDENIEEDIESIEENVNSLEKEVGSPIKIEHNNSSGASYLLNLKAGEKYKVTTTRGVSYATRNVIGGSTIQTGFFAEGDNTFTVTGDALYLSLGTFTVVEQIDVTLLLENSIIDRLDNVEDKTEFSYNKVDEALTFNGDTTFRYGAVYTNGNIAEGWASHDRAITEILNVNGDVSVELLNNTSNISFAVCGKYKGDTFVELTPQLYFTNYKCVIPYDGEYDRLVLTIKPSTGTISEEELRVLRLHCVYITGGLANTNETNKIKDFRYNIGFDFDLTLIPTPTMYSSDVIRSNDLSAYNGYWESLRLQYPQYITKIDSSVTDAQFGITRPAYLANTPIYMYKFIPKQKSGQTNINSDTIKVMLVLGTHSQERGGMFGCLQLMQYICEGWKTDRNAMMMRTAVEFYIITCLNPWGYANTGVVPYAGRINYNEVNLNRNFPTPNWRSDESSKAYYNYEGDSPASEYETKTMMAFFDIVKPNIFIDVHTSGSLNTGEIGTFEFYNDKIKNELFLIADEFTARVSADNRDYPDNPDNALIKIAKMPDSPAENGEHGTLAYYFGYRNHNTVSTLIECMGEQSYWSNGVYDTTQPAQGHTAKSMRECMQWQWCILQRLIDAYSKKIE